MKAEDFAMADVEAVTPDMLGSIEFMDADDELAPMARSIQRQTPHNQDLNVDRIKFLYTNKSKKEGGKFTIGELSARNEKERAVFDEYDYVLTVYYPTWRELDKMNKFIQLDRLLCGVEVETKESGIDVITKIKKGPFDCREYMDNMHYWGADAVLKSSEVVHLATSRIAEQTKESKSKTKTKKKKGNAED